MREKNGRSAKPEIGSCCNPSLIPQKPVADPSLNPNFDDLGGWDICTEDQMEKILLSNIEYMYREAIDKLETLGYDKDTALKAILRNGHCYGGMDVFTNILHNSLAYLNSKCGNLDEREPVFTDVSQLVEYSLAGMVCLVRQVRPKLSKGDALWCLLMSELHVGKACVIEIPGPDSSGNGGNSLVKSNVESGSSSVAPGLCGFHGGWGFGGGKGGEFSVERFFSCGAEMNLQKDFDCPKRFDVSPSLRSLLKRNVAMFAAGFRANSPKPVSFIGGPSSGGWPSAAAGPLVPAQKLKIKDGADSKSEDGISSVSRKFSDLNLEESSETPGEDPNDAIIASLEIQLKEMQKKVQERREWAYEKAMQAARKLCSDLTELQQLRMEREETQRLKKGKQVLEDATMKRIEEMENALRKASAQVDRNNATIRQLEKEKSAIRAEIEAANLSASESMAAGLEATKRAKKNRKKIAVWEKQKAKLENEIEEEKAKFKELQARVALVHQAQKEIEEKWGQVAREKEAARAELEAARRAKEAQEAYNKRRLEALRLKHEMDVQRKKDDIQRLEQELSRLRPLAAMIDSNAPEGNPDKAQPQGETIAKMLSDLDELEASSQKAIEYDRDCVLCKKEEVSIVFLPCAHQAICVGCSKSFLSTERVKCPCCGVFVEKTIRVYGTS